MAKQFITSTNLDNERDNTGLVHDADGDHPGSATLTPGYLYGGLSHPLFTSGLVGWWPLHEQSGQANDLSGNGNHGTVSVEAQGVAGKGGLTGYSFNASGHQATVLNASELVFNPNSNFTISFWSYVPSDLGDTQMAFSTSDDNDYATGYIYFYVWYSNDGGPRCAFEADGSGLEYNIVGSGDYRDDSWHHFVIHHDGSSGTATLYVDTASNASTSPAGSSSFSSSGDWGVGGRVHDTGQSYTGTLHDFRIYNRLLSSAEIQTLYDWGTADYARPPDNNDGGVSYYPFNSANANDAWGTSDGTVNGATHVADGGPRGDGAYSFDGAGDHIDLGSTFATPLGTSTWTISAWALTNAAGTYQEVIGNYDGTFPQVALQFGNDSAFDFRLTDGSNNMHVSNAGTVTGGVWTHLVGVRNGDTATLYHNGVPIGSTTNGSTAADTTSGNLFIGERPDGNGDFNGDIDDVRIYNRALTSWEVQELYQWGTRGRDMRHFTAQVV